MEKEKLDIKNLKYKHTYLIGEMHSINPKISSIIILIITDKAYYICWNQGLESYNTWKLKNDLDEKYYIIEDVSDFIEATNRNITSFKLSMDNKTNVSQSNVKTKLVQCHVCKGFGTIPDNTSTTGNKICPLCLGAKMIPESIEY